MLSHFLNSNGRLFQTKGPQNEKDLSPYDLYFIIGLIKEKATQADISGHISATLLQRRRVHNNEADKRNFN